MVMSRYPDMSNAGKSEKQGQARTLFKEAQAYAKSIISDPDKKAAYAATLAEGKSVYHALISQYMKDHKILKI